MGGSKIRRALGAVKDSTSIGLAKVGSSSSLAELEVAIVKATRHDDHPAEEKHVREILSLTRYSRPNIDACVRLISRRLGKTRSWAVALKALALVHRLLADGDPAYEQEVFFGTRRGTRMLNMADFRDAHAWDFSAFVRTFARYLDQRLEYQVYKRDQVTLAVAEDEEGSTEGEMTTERLLLRAHHLQALLDRLLACRPAGAAKDNKIVAMALHPFVKESSQIYIELTEITTAFIDRFTDLSIKECVAVHDLFSKFSKQFEELECFHSWCRSAGIARPSDYPDIEHITHNNLKVMEEFIRDQQFLRHRVDDVELSSGGPTEKVEAEVEKEESGKELVLVCAPEEKMADFIVLQADTATLPLCGGPETTQPWEAFEDTEDWEKTLVESSSKVGLLALMAGGGVGSNWSGNQSATSGDPFVRSDDPFPPSGDPFTASAAFAPPAWVQMSEMERKQRLFVEEQLMWQQYARDRMPGKLHVSGGAALYPYNQAGCTQRF